MRSEPRADQLGIALLNPAPRRAVELARRAAAAGIGRLLVSEQPDGPDSLALAAHLLGQTEGSGLRIGPGLLSLLDRHPLLLARGARTLERIAPGRTFLYVGRTSRSYVEGRLGLPYSPATERMRQALDRLLPMLAEPSDPSLAGASSEQDPAPSTIPVLLGASGERTIRLGAEHAQGVLLNGGSTADFVRWASQLSREEGRTSQVGVWCLASVRTGAGWRPELARVRRQLAGIVMEPDSGLSLLRHSGLSPQERRRLTEARAKGAERLELELEDEALLSRLAPLGTRDELWPRLAALLSAGADFLVLQPAAMTALFDL